MTPSAYSIDARRFPLVVGRASEHVRHESALDETYRLCDALLARRERMVVLFDLRGGASSPSRRKRVAEWTARHELVIKEFVPAMAVIVGSELERGFVTAVAWLKPPPIPIRVFTDQGAGEEWLLSEYARV